MDYLLEVEGLSKAYKSFSLHNVSFKLPRGFIMGFIGPNGAGKSTTIKLIMNLIRKEQGSIKLLGMDHRVDEIEIKQRIGFVYDESHYYEELTIGEMKALVAPFYRKWNESKYQQYIRRFDLLESKKIKQLSKGMKTKFSLALALSHDADLLIMDEPTSGLDPIFRSEILEVLSEIIQDEKKGVLFSTHITSDLDKIADYITFIHRGKIVFSKPRDAIMDHYAIVRGGKEFVDRDIAKYFVGTKESAYGFEALTDNANRIRELLPNKGVLIERATLEEIMLFTVRGQELAAQY